ncbi:MAG: SRPBCC domain-containing protein [bacterium]
MGEFVVEKSVDVEAPVREVWKEMIAVQEWPSWKPFMQKASIGGGYETLTNGSVIWMLLKMAGPVGTPLRVRVNRFEMPRRLGWEGGINNLVRAEHTFTFEEKGGKTRITSREDFQGYLLWFFFLFVTREDLENLHQNWLAAIKARVEGNGSG